MAMGSWQMLNIPLSHSAGPEFGGAAQQETVENAFQAVTAALHPVYQVQVPRKFEGAVQILMWMFLQFWVLRNYGWTP